MIHDCNSNKNFYITWNHNLNLHEDFERFKSGEHVIATQDFTSCSLPKTKIENGTIMYIQKVEENDNLIVENSEWSKIKKIGLGSYQYLAKIVIWKYS